MYTLSEVFPIPGQIAIDKSSTKKKHLITNKTCQFKNNYVTKRNCVQKKKKKNTTKRIQILFVQSSTIISPYKFMTMTSLTQHKKQHKTYNFNNLNRKP